MRTPQNLLSLYLELMLRRTTLALGLIALAAGSAWAADISRPSPDFVIPLTNGKQVKVSDYRGKVLCLVFILTT